MVRCKNVGGGLGDDDRCPPPLSSRDKGKAKMQEPSKKKKRKWPDSDTQMAIAIAEAAASAERGGSLYVEDLDPAWVARARQIVEAGGPHGTVMIGG